MQRAPRPPASFDTSVWLQRLKKPQYALPAAVVVGMLGIAFGVQPTGAGSTPTDIATTPIERSEPTPTAAPTQPTLEPTAEASNTPADTASPDSPSRTPPAGATSDVAGARSTPEATATIDPELQRQPTQCGELKETTLEVAVEQAISSVSVKATRVAVYPIDYFRCILMATGGQEAYSLAGSVLKAEQAGQTHIALIDLWIANGSKLFGQVNVRGAALSAAGQTFGPTATLGGRSEVVVSSGQGRNLSLVFAIKNTIGETTGPMTLVVEAPLIGGEQVAGKYHLFLPTP